MDAAIRFYEQIGLTLKQRWENHYAMVTTEGITIGLHPADGGETGSGSLCWVYSRCNRRCKGFAGCQEHYLQRR